MDNNLINIDDLFKQRLGGGEEPERDGAWMRMKELLEEDERRKPVVFWWRRAVGFGGALVLLATATWGGYEAFTTFRAPGSGNEAGLAANSLPATPTSAGKAASVESKVTGRGTAANSAEPVQNATQHADAINTTNHTATVSSAVARINNAGIKKHQNRIASSLKSTAVSKQVVQTGNQVTSAVTASTSAKHSILSGHSFPSGKAGEQNINTGSTTTNGTQSQATDQGMAVNTVAGTNPAIVHIDQVDANVKGKKPLQQVKKNTSQPRNNVKSDKPVAMGNTAVADADIIAEQARQHIGGGHSNTSQKAASHSATAVQRHKSMTSAPTGSRAVADNNTQAQQQKMVSRLKDRQSKGNAHGTAATATPVAEKHTAGRNTTTATTVNPLKVLSSSVNTGGKPSDKAIDKAIASAVVPTTTQPEAETTTVKKSVRQITMKQSTTGEFTGKPVTSLDTINDHSLTLEEKHIKHRRTNTGNGTALNDEFADSETAGSLATTGKGGNTNGGNSLTAGKQANAGAKAGMSLTPVSAKAGEEKAGESQPLLAAAPPKPAKMVDSVAPAPSTPEAPKPTETVKKKSGMHFLQKLSDAFNDIKLHVSTAEVGTGLTGGINGTFFGPTSFKGFQFGGVANFVFDEKWSASAELKYFNRMNNNYAMHVTYDKYDPVSGGYMMETKDKSYSFSTLHSFELPLALRYTYKNFTVMAGGNLAYSLAINPGDNEVSLDPLNPPVFVTSIGANSTPSLNGGTDFGARVGLGYLFGFNLKVAPNVNLDLRNVQTFWDNASGSGARKVSDQLYKSPSIQFSVIYRLGNHGED